MPRHIVSRVIPGSIADEMGVEPSDELLSINGQTVEDVLDYHFLTNEEYDRPAGQTGWGGMGAGD